MILTIQQQIAHLDAQIKTLQQQIKTAQLQNTLTTQQKIQVLQQQQQGTLLNLQQQFATYKQSLIANANTIQTQLESLLQQVPQGTQDYLEIQLAILNAKLTQVPEGQAGANQRNKYNGKIKDKTAEIAAFVNSQQQQQKKLTQQLKQTQSNLSQNQEDLTTATQILKHVQSIDPTITAQQLLDQASDIKTDVSVITSPTPEELKLKKQKEKLEKEISENNTELEAAKNEEAFVSALQLRGKKREWLAWSVGGIACVVGILIISLPNIIRNYFGGRNEFIKIKRTYRKKRNAKHKTKNNRKRKTRRNKK
jgi:hypothetical protein